MALNYSWNVIHRSLRTKSAPKKLHKDDKMRDTTYRRKVNNSTKRIIWEEALTRRLEFDAGSKLPSSLSVVHTKQLWETFVCYWACLKEYSGWSMFGNGCVTEDEWKSVLHVLTVHHSQMLGLAMWLTNSFPAQKPQDCVVVGGGNQIQKQC